MNELNKQIECHMRILQLKGMLPVYREFGEKATMGKLQYEEYLSLLLEEEVRRKTDGSVKAKIAKAKFPFIKTLEAFDFSFQPFFKKRIVYGKDTSAKKDSCRFSFKSSGWRFGWRSAKLGDCFGSFGLHCLY